MSKTKKELVKMIVNEELETDDHDYLIDMLVENPIARNIDRQLAEKSGFWSKLSDKLAEFAGSWGFIIGFVTFIIIWILGNLYLLSREFDPYPFILLNLFLSCISALQSPIIMMSQNRQAEKDRLREENDYKVDTKSELILEDLHHKMNELLKNQKELQKQINDLQKTNTI